MPLLSLHLVAVVVVLLVDGVEFSWCRLVLPGKGEELCP